MQINKPELNLLTFPSEIWPKNTDVEYLQSQLTTLFYTDFSREKWIVAYQGSKIEIVLDQGSIYAGARKKPIMEIELELKKGTLLELLALAKKFVNIEGLRVANKSRAERGYALVENRENIDINHFLPNFNRHSLLIAEGLNQLLEHWQHYEECWLEKQPQAKQHVGHLLVLIQQFLIHYSHWVPHFIQALPLKEQTALFNCCGYSTGRTLL